MKKRRFKKAYVRKTGRVKPHYQSYNFGGSTKHHTDILESLKADKYEESISKKYPGLFPLGLFTRDEFDKSTSKHYFVDWDTARRVFTGTSKIPEGKLPKERLAFWEKQYGKETKDFTKQPRLFLTMLKPKDYKHIPKKIREEPIGLRHLRQNFEGIKKARQEGKKLVKSKPAYGLLKHQQSFRTPLKHKATAPSERDMELVRQSEEMAYDDPYMHPSELHKAIKRMETQPKKFLIIPKKKKDDSWKKELDIEWI